MSVDRRAMQSFLRDVAESEHNLRHPDVFAMLVAEQGFALDRFPHKFEVRDPEAKEPAAEK